MAEKYTLDFEYFWGRIHRGEPFALARYGDGEFLLIRGRGVGKGTQAYKEDKWTAPSRLTVVGRELLETLGHAELNYFYGIPTISEGAEAYGYFMENVPQEEERFTFANILVNANYTRTQEEFEKLQRPVHLVCNYRAAKERFPFSVSSITGFPDDCIRFWRKKPAFIEGLVKEARGRENELYFISCGPLSEIIIHRLYEAAPGNTYIDVGSTIDPYVHGRKTRAYMDTATPYSRLVSSFGASKA